MRWESERRGKEGKRREGVTNFAHVQLISTLRFLVSKVVVSSVKLAPVAQQ
jgi:hypothetical protein